MVELVEVNGHTCRVEADGSVFMSVRGEYKLLKSGKQADEARKKASAQRARREAYERRHGSMDRR